jgi:hypothetical protein
MAPASSAARGHRATVAQRFGKAERGDGEEHRVHVDADDCAACHERRQQRGQPAREQPCGRPRQAGGEPAGERHDGDR